MSAAQTTMATREFLTLKEFCDRFKCSRSHAGRLIKSGRLKIARMGVRTIRISPESIDAFERSLVDPGNGECFRADAQPVNVAADPRDGGRFMADRAELATTNK